MESLSLVWAFVQKRWIVQIIIDSFMKLHWLPLLTYMSNSKPSSHFQKHPTLPKSTCVFGTLDLNPDSGIQIHNHRVPQQKMMFGTRFLSEDWNPNLNFMWVSCQIWVQPFTYFWIQSGFKSGLNSCGSQFITVTRPTRSFFLPIFSLSPPLYASLSLALSTPFFSHYRALFWLQLTGYWNFLNFFAKI